MKTRKEPVFESFKKFDGCGFVAIYTSIRVRYRRLHKSFYRFRKTTPQKTPGQRKQMKFALAVTLIAIAPPLIIGEVTIAANNQPGATQIYAKHCASCHGKDGRARTFKAKFNHARDLTDPLWQDEVSDERLFNSIMNGKKKMPAYRKKLSESQVNSLIAYVRTLAR